MLTKISWRSFLRQYRDYSIYFICMMLAVMIYYSFGAMTNDQPLVQRAQPDIQISYVLSLGNLFMLLILAGFMLSANRFFVVKRYREVGLYQLFGLRKSRIIMQFVIENFIMNTLAFVSGIVMGIIFSKFFSMILIKAMDLELASHFFISLRSIYATMIVFFWISLVIAGQNAWLIYRHQLIDLFEAKSQNTIRKMPATLWTGIFGGMGLFFLVGGYWLSFFSREYMIHYISATGSYGIVFWLPFLVLVLCIIGTYLFYRFTLKALFECLRRLRRRSYQYLRFYAYGSGRFQMLNNWRSLAFATLATAAAITVIAGAISVISIRSQILFNSNPTDFQIRGEENKKLEQEIKAVGGEVTEETQLHFKVTVAHMTRRFLHNDESQQEQLYDLLTEEEYAAFSKQHKELPEIHLNTGQEAVLFDYEYNIFRNLTTVDRKFILPNGQAVQVNKIYPDYLGDSNMRYGAGVLVVKQSVYEKANGIIYPVAMIDAKMPSDRSWSQKLGDRMTTEWGDEIRYNYQYTTGHLSAEFTKEKIEDSTADTTSFSYNRLNFTSRYRELRRFRRESGIFVYVAIFIGVTVSVTTAGIMMLRQFSQMSNERENFQLLKKLGISRGSIRSLIYRQLSWVFLPPVLLITGHSCFAIHLWAQFIHSDAYWLAYLFCLVMALLYVIAYLITAHFYIRSVESQ